MSEITNNLKRIENLEVNQLAEALELNGYARCVGVIRTKLIDGQAFLKLTELQLSLWRLPASEARRLWSFMQQIRQDPTQFLMNSQISNKTAPKVNKLLNKPPINDSVMNSNLSNKPNFSINKPNTSVKLNSSNRFIKPAQTSETKDINSLTLTKESNLLPTNRIHVQKSEQTSETKEMKSSTLNKEDSKFIKNTLEQLLKKDSNETPNSSFIHNQSQPLLPPKPDHLKVIAPMQDKHEEIPEYDGYLAPIKKKIEPQTPETEKRSSISRNDCNRTSFINKFRRNNYDNLEIRPEVVENKYEEQISKTIVQSRPLPPVPLQQKKINVSSVIPLDSDDEDLGEYTSVPDDVKPDLKKKSGKPHRPLPPVPRSEAQQNRQQLNDAETDEELAEYTSVIDEDETEIKSTLSHRIIKTSRSPLPPLNIPGPSNFRTKAKLPTPDKEDLTPKLQQISFCRPRGGSEGTSFRNPPFDTLTKGSRALLKPGCNLPFPATLPRANLPKPPTNLPKPPMSLPSPSDFLNDSENNLTSFNFVENYPQDKRILTPPVLKTESAPANMNTVEDEHSFYTEIDLARESSYRETDRKGARRLLTGLENGAFLIRPSRHSAYICTISIMHSTKMFNLGIERNSEGALGFTSVAPDFDQPMFYNIAEVITYYSIHPLYLSGESIVLKDVLPRNKY